jgi:SAM-dependent methyltransferase
MPADIVDFKIPDPIMHPAKGAWSMLRRPMWDDFFESAVRRIFERGGLVVDIGGGLRIDEARGDKADPKRVAMFGKYLTDARVQYKVTDYTAQYHPDFVEDIHQLSFANDSIDSLFCLAVLEHVYDPKKACEELTRVLKKGGLGLIYVPFMYRYHANVTEDYKDYYRYSKDGIGYLLRNCRHVEICPVRGLFESLLRFTPLHQFAPLRGITRLMDWGPARMKMISQRQSSGYLIVIEK